MTRRQCVVNSSADPGHQAKSVDLRSEGRATRSVGCRAWIYHRLTRRVRQPRIRKASTNATNVGCRDHVVLSKLALILNMPLMRVRIFVIWIVVKAANSPGRIYG